MGLVNTANNVYLGFVWSVKGSRGDAYQVTMRREGFTCTCMGFRGHRHCKHADAIDRLVGGDYDDPVYQIPCL